MKKRDIKIEIEELSYDELDAADRELVDNARMMTANSYAPYSRFHVGAAIRMDNGAIVTGANQENAAFPSSTCAERTACYYASARYPGMPMRKIAIAAWTQLHKPAGREHDFYFQNKPISPCGACRQALLEYEAQHGPIEVILYGSDTIYRLPSVASLLPLCFTDF